MKVVLLKASSGLAKPWTLGERGAGNEDRKGKKGKGDSNRTHTMMGKGPLGGKNAKREDRGIRL